MLRYLGTRARVRLVEAAVVVATIVAVVLIAASNHPIRPKAARGIGLAPLTVDSGRQNHSRSLTGSFPTAESWIHSLNQQGIPCRFQRKRHPDNAFFKYQDSGSCAFDSGHTLTVWIVKDAEKTFRKRFASFLKTPSPARYFYRQNWLVMTFQSIPKEAIQTIGESFHAHMRQNLS
jgi:hypothetical protein